ncbi:LOW QUALITY PROTEIN: G2/M phase-specific E3 ubiquitin-protein ligase-like, partial [Pezoporus wallicus]|uniref:LOW QUALITY PROTEIN: G2/M phase-specific E3 ubiquitin-protein ligase-like n=1 Tax=Pezoporus wallicus TaxID=35540 RepID=UPI00254F7E86
DCFVCGERGATITCQEVGCDHRFHLPCAVEGECVTRYLPPSRSFCQEHHPQQQDLVAPEGTVCLICMDPVEGRTTYGTMVCPACRTTWFHRACIQVGAVLLLWAWQALSSRRASLALFMFLLQGQAMHSGAFVLGVPSVSKSVSVSSEMINMGIQIPLRPWQLFLCSSCAAVGTHRGCSNLGNSEATWECDSCAGLGSSSSARSELAGPSTVSSVEQESRTTADNQ